MAINAYTGLMGSGKTYEVVLSVILPAIKSGRDVVTNIRGLQYELICAHLKEPNAGCEFGKIRVVNNEHVQGDDFFPAYNDTLQKFEYTDKTVVQPGNLVAIDEAWRPWGTDSKCIKAHMSFFREHRQCVDAKGTSCDLVVITQDIGDIHRLLKAVIEMSLRFTKLKTLGLSKRYRIEIYEGARLYKTKLTNWSTRNYDKAIFPLYKSYASDSGAGIEKVIDGRQNIFKSGMFVVPVVLAVLFLGGGIWGMTRFFSGAGLEEKPLVASVENNSGAPGAPGAVGQSSPAASKPASPSMSQSSASVVSASIAGTVRIGSDDWVVLATADGLRMVSPSLVYSRGVSAITKDDLKAVPSYLMNP
ncbi:MAG TPA: Zonular occludens toxin [Thiobacillus sp.]|nr:Zonular occludens toxin [Thiobacillus sp.]